MLLLLDEMYQQLRVSGEDFIGLFGFATDKYALLSHNFPKTNALDVKTLKTKVYGTNLVGMFCAGNSNGVLLPYFVSDNEIKEVKKYFKGLKLNVARVKDRCTALGNLVACNDNAAVVSPLIRDVDMIKETLGVDIKREKVAGHDEVGACLFVTNKGFLAHPDAENDLKKLSKLFGVPGMIGTVNCGVPFIKSGIIANSAWYLAGSKTTGIELGRIDEALGFL